MSGTSSATRRVRLVISADATRFGSNPNLSMASWTRRRVDSRTCGLLFRTRDTVARDTLASRATSLIVTLIETLLPSTLRRCVFPEKLNNNKRSAWTGRVPAPPGRGCARNRRRLERGRRHAFSVPRRPWCKLREPTNLFGPTGRNPGHRVERRAPKPLSSALMTVQTLQEQASERLGPPKEDVGTKRRIECSRGSASKQISEFNNR